MSLNKLSLRSSALPRFVKVFMFTAVMAGVLGLWIFQVWLKQMSLFWIASQKRQMDHLEEVIRTHTSSVHEPGDLRDLSSRLNGVFIGWMDPLGATHCVGDCRRFDQQKNLLQTDEVQGRLDRVTDEGIFRRWRDQLGREWIIGTSQDPFRRLLKKGAFLLMGYLVLGWGFMIAAVLWFHRKVMRPIHETTATLKALSSQNSVSWLLSESEVTHALVDAVNELMETWTHRMRHKQQESFQWAAVLAAMNEGVVVMDAEERVVFLNEAARRILRHHHGDGLQNTSLIELSRTPRIKAVYEKAMTSKRPQQEEIRIQGPTPCWVSLEAVPISDHQGWEGIVMMLRDISQVKQLDAVRRDFVANVSHELRTPVTNIQGYAETLVAHRQDMAEDEQTQYLDVIVGESKRLAQLIQDTLTLARWDALPRVDLRPLDVVLLVREGIAVAAASARRHQVSVDLHGPDRIIWRVDPFAFRQIMANLIDNAIKYNKPQGWVKIDMGVEDNTLCIRIADTGMGISQEHLPFIFDRFYRVDASRSRRSGGTGLGLSIVKQAVEIHGGSVFCSSRLGEGTEFTLQFPDRLGEGQAS